MSENISPNSIDPSQWTLYDKVMYGGLGYGSFCLPTKFFNIIIAIIFPPLGELINIIGSQVSSSVPFFSWGILKTLYQKDNMYKIIYSFLLTSFFYIPGLIYTLANISESEANGT
jgi:uncharacterized membrane protein YqaE (UPF0057 family)